MFKRKGFFDIFDSDISHSLIALRKNIDIRYFGIFILIILYFVLTYDGHHLIIRLLMDIIILMLTLPSTVRLK
jgi:hypothetical protein